MMSESRQSLIEQAKQQPQQPTLFGGGGSEAMDAALFAAEETGAGGRSPEFTGARLFSQKPETYQAIVALSAEGLGVLRIARLLHVSPNTVLAVRAREPREVDIEKRRIATLTREAARMTVEAILDQLQDPVQVEMMSLKDRAITFGILAEKAELLSGGPTARLEVADATTEDVLGYLRWLRAEYDRRRAIGSGAREEGQKALEPWDGDPAAGPVGGEAGNGGAEADRGGQDDAQGPGAGLGTPAEGGPEGVKPGKSSDSQTRETPANIDQNEGPNSISEGRFDER